MVWLCFVLIFLSGCFCVPNLGNLSFCHFGCLDSCSSAVLVFSNGCSLERTLLASNSGIPDLLVGLISAGRHIHQSTLLCPRIHADKKNNKSGHLLLLISMLSLVPYTCVLPMWLSGKESSCQCRRRRFYPWVGKNAPVFLPGKSHGQRSLVGYSPWGHRRARHNLATKQQQAIYLAPSTMDHIVRKASQVALVVRKLPADTGDIRDVGSIPGLGSSRGGGHSNPLLYSCLEHPTDRGVW